jgi:hypothetical protein
MWEDAPAPVMGSRWLRHSIHRADAHPGGPTAAMAAELSLQFWDTGRLLVQGPGRWEVRSWPDWRLLEVGVGIAVAEPGGDRLAVAAPDGTIGVAGAAARTLPPVAGTPTELVWSGDSVVVPPGRPVDRAAPDPAGVPAERSSLWRLPLDGTPAT